MEVGILILRDISDILWAENSITRELHCRRILVCPAITITKLTRKHLEMNCKCLGGIATNNNELSAQVMQPNRDFDRFDWCNLVDI